MIVETLLPLAVTLPAVVAAARVPVERLRVEDHLALVVVVDRAEAVVADDNEVG